MAPLPLPPGPSSWPVSALGTVADVQPCPSSGPAEPFYAFLQYGSSCQGLLMGFPDLSEFFLSQSVPPFSLGSSVTMAGWMSDGGLWFSAFS